MPRPVKPEDQKLVPACTRIFPSELAALNEIANKEDRNLAYIVARAIREHLLKHGKKTVKLPRDEGKPPKPDTKRPKG